MLARPFAPDEQYAFTDGLCHLFAMAAHPKLGGQPTILNSTDPRHLKTHDWPEDEPLHLHAFLLMPDGSAVDGEGRRSVEEMARSFGIKEDYSYELIPDPTWSLCVSAKGDRGQAWLAVIAARLDEQGWTAEDVPACDRVLSKTKAFRAAKDTWFQEGHLTYEAKVKSWMESQATLSPQARRRRRP